jgi:hypothetical protein
MATLTYKGRTLKVRVSHNVLSEFIDLRNTTFSEVMNILRKDPMGWTRDILYCSLLVYNPDVLDGMTKWEVGDEMFDNLGTDEVSKFTTDLLNDFAVSTGVKSKKVASKKK